MQCYTVSFGFHIGLHHSVQRKLAVDYRAERLFFLYTEKIES